MSDKPKTEKLSYTKAEMAAHYGVGHKTWITWERKHLKELKKLGYDINQKIYTPAQSALLFEKLG